MKTICFVRHANSKKNGTTDYTRTLNKSGAQEAKTLAKNLKKEFGQHFDIIISSPAIRAFETSLIFADKLGLGEEKIELKEALYNLDMDQNFIDTINSLDNSLNNILIIGHNPSIENTAKFLNHEFIHTFYTSSALYIEIDVNSWKQVTADSGKFIFYKFNRFNPDLSRLDKIIASSIKNEIYSKIENSLKEIETNLLSADLNGGEYESEKLADKIYQKTDIITIRSLSVLNDEIKKYENIKRMKVEKKIQELDQILNKYNADINEKNNKKISEIENKKRKLLQKIEYKTAGTSAVPDKIESPADNLKNI